MFTNLDYSKDLLEYSANNNINMVYASSASVYGNGNVFKEKPENESSLNHYSESKLLFDNFVRENFSKYLDFEVFRPERDFGISTKQKFFTGCQKIK